MTSGNGNQPPPKMPLPGPGGLVSGNGRSGTHAPAHVPTEAPSSRWATLGAILRQRCPRCHAGKIFRTAVQMNKSCPVCGLSLQREAGYFLGAMYISYPLAILVLGLFTFIGHLLLPSWNLEWVVLLAAIPYVPLMTVVFRYSRVLWIYFERSVSQDPYQEARR